jgi:hypothetical protein
VLVLAEKKLAELADKKLARLADKKLAELADKKLARLSGLTDLRGKGKRVTGTKDINCCCKIQLRWGTRRRSATASRSPK